MFLKKLINCKSLEGIYNHLKHINYENFMDLRARSYYYIDFNKKFDIIDISYNDQYNVKIIQLFDNTRVNMCYDSVYMCLNGSYTLNDSYYNSHCTPGDVQFVNRKGTFHTIYNPNVNDSICILFEKSKIDFYYFR